MTTLPEALRTRILASSTITDAIGTCCYVNKAGQKTATFPYVVIFPLGGDPIQHLGGDTGVERGLVQINVYAKGNNTTIQSEELSRLIQAQLVGYRGDVGTVKLLEISRASGLRHEAIELNDAAGDYVNITQNDYFVTYRF